MKRVFVRALFLTMIGLTAPGASAQMSEVPGLRSWYNFDRQQIDLVPDAVLVLRWQDLQGDPEYAARVQLELSTLTTAEFEKRAQQVYAADPSYRPVRAPIRSSMALRVQISALGVDETVNTHVVTNGPYFLKAFGIKKSQLSLARAMFGRDFAFLSGHLTARVSVEEKLEEKILEPEICHQLLPDGATFLSFIQNLRRIKQAETQDLQYESTGRDLLYSMLFECVQTPSLADVHGFADLFQLKITRNPAPGAIRGRHSRSVRKEVEIPLQYSVQVEKKS